MEARIDGALGHATRDPHGDPISSWDGAVAALGDRRLLDLEPGGAAVIVRASDRDPEQLRGLGGLGLYPGVAIVVLDKLPFEGPVRIGMGEAKELIGPPLVAVVRVTSRASAA
ncbi:MAG: ferrous iron transport protein A [Chloroflexota bacterium]|nr:ferrous iron transport protein A [Chloroflexota bacterium]